ncbi:unnamed protein product [Zymoseptoria tritici ST99CH_1E4]|uniref:Uncharacterized protein n=1 Tax=Zymoseptoria tritici ST99CH_1E4 TaxID=1276532 RepID=A0A2H1FPK5_ZYMTR|nr:unnamed protein product [Zymoseptoria tritici ST99CH_1E4]
MRVLSTAGPNNRIRSTLEDVISPALFLATFLIFTTTFFTTRDGASNDTSNGFSCSSDNPTFPWQSGWNEIWDLSMFLSVNLAGGRFTFSQAKAIDISWDLIIGRGGQMFAAFVAYRVMRRSLLRSMESRPMHIPVTATLVFDGLSLSSLIVLYKDLVATLRKERRWNWRLFAFLWMVVYLTSFGTIVSAMTGYQTQTTPYLRFDVDPSISSSGNFSNTNDLIASRKIVKGRDSAVVEDGKRIGLEPFATLSSTAQPQEYNMITLYLDNMTAKLDRNNHSECLNGATDHIRDPDFEIKFSRSGNRCVLVNSNMTFRNTTYDLGIDPLKIKIEPIWTVDGTELSRKYLEENSVCQPGKTYKWGFSCQLLLLFCSMTTVYAGIVAALHWDVCNFGRANNLDHRTGLYRDILDLAQEIDNELDVDDKEVYLTAAVLETKITTQTGSIAVEAKDLPPRRRDVRRSKRAEIEEEAARDYEAFLRK